MAVSIHDDPAPLSDLQKLPLHRGKVIVRVVLDGEKAGLIQKTGKNKHHHSWWRPNDFPILQYVQAGGV